MILRKLGLSENFLRYVLYSRKTAWGVGFLSPLTIIDTLAMKLYLGHIRANNSIKKLIQINKDNARLQYGYSKIIIDTDRQEKEIK